MIGNLINELDAIDEEFILVLDDYYLIQDNAVHNIVNTLLKYPPQNMHMVIITRKAPPLKINFLRAYDRVHEIRMKELSFNKQETTRLFKKVLDVELKDKTAQNLLDKTKWDNVSQNLLKLSKREYINYPRVKYGYCNGREPIDYVERIMKRYQYYSKLKPLK